MTPTLLALEKQQHPAVAPGEPPLDVFVAPVNEGQRRAAFLLTNRLRAGGVSCDTDYEDKSLKALFKAAEEAERFAGQAGRGQ